MRVEISRLLLEVIVSRAAEDSAEICGLLFGASTRIAGEQPTANVAANPARHFEIDPAALIAAHRAARFGGPVIIGHYHSHPGGLAMPSAVDTASARPDGSLWLIVAGGDARLWVARAGSGGVAFEEAQLAIL
ncbi:M67 family metallopeptidase [Sphingobium sp. AN558]|uniref:Mov34/MPN/PAD-1 family protein n=1 Tax=Sphingobium sp. AN558 TaxID=3133442 RepID=UPI0030BCDFB4